MGVDDVISVCIITKNEKDKLLRCLEALRGHRLEVVIVDTGSTDGTREMLAQWAKREDRKCSVVLGEFAWCDDFSKARNYAASLASSDKIFALDSDETVTYMNLNKLERKMDANPDGVGTITINNEEYLKGNKTFSSGTVARIYDRRNFEFQKRIHEQICYVGSDGEVSRKHFRTDVAADHDGYFGTVQQMNDKAWRNVRLLEAELDDKGENPYMLYHLGNCYSSLKETEKALDAFERALAFPLNSKVDYVAALVEAYGYLLINSGRAQKALELEQVYNLFEDTADFCLLMGHIYMKNAMFDKAIEQFLKATQCKKASTQGANGELAYYNAGVIYEVMGKRAQAMEMYEKCGDYAPARRQLRGLKGE